MRIFRRPTVPLKYRTGVRGGFRLSPVWDDEAAVFDPVSTQIFVVTASAAHLLSAVQRHPAPVSVAELVADLGLQPGSRVPASHQGEVESMLVELERLGFVESTIP